MRACSESGRAPASLATVRRPPVGGGDRGTHRCALSPARGSSQPLPHGRTVVCVARICHVRVYNKAIESLSLQSRCAAPCEWLDISVWALCGLNRSAVLAPRGCKLALRVCARAGLHEWCRSCPAGTPCAARASLAARRNACGAWSGCFPIMPMHSSSTILRGRGLVLSV